MAEAALRAAAEESGSDVVADSAGTGDWHIGDPMDHRAYDQLTRRGYPGAETHRARQIDPSWLSERDLFLAMDSANLADLRRMAVGVPGAAERIMLFGEAGGLGGAEIPDPWNGTEADFARVLDTLEKAAPAILASIPPR
jgi:protein-tyrosine phosphatase